MRMGLNSVKQSNLVNNNFEISSQYQLKPLN